MDDARIGSPGYVLRKWLRAIYNWPDRQYFKHQEARPLIPKVHFPDKCDHCALQIAYDNDPRFDEYAQKVSELARRDLADYYSRQVYLSTTNNDPPTTFCGVGNSKYWGPSKIHVRCPDWQHRYPS